MCGRFSLAVPPEMLRELFGADGALELPPRYNVAPTQDVAIVRRDPSGSRRIALARWGLLGSAKMINARQETVFERSPFSRAIRTQRCLVPADGFFEWKKLPGGVRQPLRFRMAGGEVFALAGIFDRWRSPAGEVVDTCSVLTTRPNALVEPVHDRMPVILGPESWELWLDPKVRGREALEPVLVPFPAGRMAAEPVSRRVNDVNHDDPACIEVVEEPPAPAAVQLAFDLD